MDTPTPTTPPRAHTPAAGPTPTLQPTITVAPTVSFVQIEPDGAMPGMFAQPLVLPPAPRPTIPRELFRGPGNLSSDVISALTGHLRQGQLDAEQREKLFIGLAGITSVTESQREAFGALCEAVGRALPRSLTSESAGERRAAAALYLRWNSVGAENDPDMGSSIHRYRAGVHEGMRALLPGR